MKIFILSDPNSIHTKRWISSLSENGIEIFLFGLNHPEDNYYNQFINTIVYSIACGSISGRTSFKKIRYLKVLNVLKKKISEFNPDILHAHYATSYGLLGALTRFHPYIISIWGSDIYDFPNISVFHRALLRYNLSKADHILSTSNIMAVEAKKYTDKTIGVTPFGVDLKLFRKLDILKQKDEFIVGSVKSLEPLYGIDLLIKSFKLVLNRNPDRKLKLWIIGSGSDKIKLKSLVHKLKMDENVDFLGRKDNRTLTEYYNRFSVFVSLSNQESFGVVAVESMACECPVIVSYADGFTEVVVNGMTGYIVPRRDIEATAGAIQKFIDNNSLGCTMGRQGRKRVEQLYDWDKNVALMINIYKSVISKKEISYEFK